MENRIMMIIDGYKFEVNTIGKYTETQFRDTFKDLPNFHWKNAYNQLKKRYNVEFGSISKEGNKPE